MFEGADSQCILNVVIGKRFFQYKRPHLRPGRPDRIPSALRLLGSRDQVDLSLSAFHGRGLPAAAPSGVGAYKGGAIRPSPQKEVCGVGFKRSFCQTTVESRPNNWFVETYTNSSCFFFCFFIFLIFIFIISKFAKQIVGLADLVTCQDHRIARRQITGGFMFG